MFQSITAQIQDFKRYALTTIPRQALSLWMTCQWQQSSCQWQLNSSAKHSIKIKEIVLFDDVLALSADCPFYGEGFQMLAQTGGTISQPQAIGRCPDDSHYRIPSEAGFHSSYNYILLSPRENHHILLGFSSCFRFSGTFRLSANGRLKIIVDCEDLPLAGFSHWQGELLVILEGTEPALLLHQYGQLINQNHVARKQSLQSQNTPSGWCSWYHYYADLHEADISENLQQMRQQFTALDYLLIDDGYQAYMGDWLTPSPRFGAGLAGIVEQIHRAGVKPALWVAPFIAEGNSAIFKQHPDWFVKDENGAPLAAEKVTYGGWRCTPWYVLDGTHPQVQKHLKTLMRYLHQALGITLFKLDANFWGAIHGGYFYDPTATRIEAYRRGMAAICEGAGESFLLGCNAPLWPSLGMVNGMRVGDDVERNGDRFYQIAQEILHRSWQNQVLWINDPDCITLENVQQQIATPEQYRLHLLTVLACNGLLVAGDRLAGLSETSREQLAKLLNNEFAGLPTEFKNRDFRHATIVKGKATLHLLFNWENDAVVINLPVEAAQKAQGFFGDELLSASVNKVSVHIAARSAAALIIK
ncbi:glycoside hydrolase family 36 protein [Psychromonas antarctica]|uniref:glycoside hydrolase family 36 protein n=1 Tax=Psychromonas antarctica TaxID=67573 RepID=UPI001EE95717|nr:glycoside hydrolase family 36 protein [Psychromonas antarctica]MCG6200558.1 alpha-galactosidase [Psychromonas antarctica]